MIWLANIFLGLVQSLLTILGVSLAKKAVYAATAAAALLALTTAFIAVVKALLYGIVATLPAWAATGAALLLPSNLSACISAILAAKIARWIYDYHVETLKLVSYIT